MIGAGLPSVATALRGVDNARPDVLGQIEALGWRLENVGYVFVETGTTSSARVMMSGEATAVRGVVLGIYLFRNVNLRPS